jgi:hypothetical protein
MVNLKFIYNNLKILLVSNITNILVIKEVFTKIAAIVTILVLRKFEPSLSNDYSYYLALILNLSMFAGFSIPSAFQIHILDKIKTGLIFIVSTVLIIFLLSLIVIVILKWNNSISGTKYKLDYEYIYALIISNVLFQLIQYIYLGLKKIRFFSLSMILYSFFSSLGLILIIFSNFSNKIVIYFTFSIVLSLSFIVIGFVNLFRVANTEFSLLMMNDFKKVKGLLKVSSVLFLIGIPVLVPNYYLNHILISHNELYNFSFQWAISSQIMNLVMMPTTAKLPMILNLFHQTSTQYQNLIRNELRLTLLLTLFSCFCAIGLTYFLNLNYSALSIYLLSAPFQVYLLVNSQLLILRFKWLAFFLNSVWGMIFLLLLYLFADFGFTFICLAYSFSYLICFLIMISYNRSLIRNKFIFKTVLL